MLAHSARDKLAVLGTEVKNRDRLANWHPGLCRGAMLRSRLRRGLGADLEVRRNFQVVAQRDAVTWRLRRHSARSAELPDLAFGFYRRSDDHLGPMHLPQIGSAADAHTGSDRSDEIL